MAGESSSRPPRTIAATSATRGLLLLMLLGNLLLNVTFVATFVLNPVDYCLTSREAVDFIDVNFVWVQMGAALITAALGFGALSIALKPVAERLRTERFLSIAALMLVGAACCSAGLVAPVSDGRAHAVRALIAAQTACGLIAAYAAHRTRKRSKRLPVDLEDIDTAPAFRHLFQDEQGRPSLERLEHLLEMRSVRGSIRAELRAGNRMLSWFGVVLGLLSLFGWSAELSRTLGSEPALLDAPMLHELNRPDAVEAYFGDTPTQVPGTARVVVVVVSGMRDDALEAVPALRALLESTEFRRDATRLRLRIPTPSNSVPQWLALLTGATSELTGVLADRRTPETPFDSVARQARLHGLSSFATGSPWFTELFHSELMREDRFFAEGTVPPPYAAAQAARPFAVAVEFVRCLFVGDGLQYSDVSMIYLCKVYMLCWATLALVVVLAAQAAASHSFLLPHLLPLRFDHDEGWTWRFQLSTLRLFATLLLLCSAAMLRSWPATDLTTAHYDKLYSLAMLKHEKQRGASTKSDEVIGLLEEETEALISKNYRTAKIDDDDDP